MAVEILGGVTKVMLCILCILLMCDCGWMAVEILGGVTKVMLCILCILLMCDLYVTSTYHLTLFYKTVSLLHLMYR